MPLPVVILHGWSDTDASFKPLAEFLRSAGRSVLPIYLGNYVTLEDSLTIQDLAKAFVPALADAGIPTSNHSFDLIVHSTGALVAREWLTRYYLEPGLPCPVAHFLMLAPANFGSPLAHKGRTMFGRLVKGWKSGFETGTQILKALEMASPYTWALAERDLFGTRSYYKPDECMVAVLVGNQPYREWPQSMVNERGSDGTVYVASANLNATRLTITLGRKEDRPLVERTQPRFTPVAFAVIAGRDHSTITRPEPGDLPGALILRFLALESGDSYRSYSEECSRITDGALPLQSLRDLPDEAHRYQNVVVKVRDDLGLSVPDYFLEFYESNPRSNEVMARVQREVLEKVHPYNDDESYRSLIFDLTDLDRVLADGTRLLFSVSAASVGSLVEYSAGKSNDVGALEVPVNGDAQRFWRPNETMLTEVVIERVPKPKVFRVRPYRG